MLVEIQKDIINVVAKVVNSTIESCRVEVISEEGKILHSYKYPSVKDIPCELREEIMDNYDNEIEPDDMAIAKEHRDAVGF